MLRNVLLIASVLSTVSPAKADLTYADFDNFRQDVATKSYLAGVAHGILMTSTGVRLKYGTKLYCQPDSLALDVDQYVALVDSYIAKHRNLVDKPLAFVMLLALSDAFPC